MWTIILFFIAHWYLSLFFQTFFMHRYAAHGMFTMSKRNERIFQVLSWIFMGSNYLSPFGYGVMHRMHHAFADTSKDPHSPSFDENIFKMMWKTKIIYSSITKKQYIPESRFTENVPDWPLFDRIATSWVSRVGWGALYTLVYIQFAPSIYWYALLPLQWALAPIHGAIINWFAHTYGYVNFKVGGTSKNFLPFDFLMMGESYHNNHHKHGNRANFGGIRWHEIDPTYLIIRIFNSLGIVKLNRMNEQKISVRKAA